MEVFSISHTPGNQCYPLFSADFELKVLHCDLAITRKSAYAEGTKKGHFLQWKTYIKFCLFFELEPFPASADTISLFAQLLSQTV